MDDGVFSERHFVDHNFQGGTAEDHFILEEHWSIQKNLNNDVIEGDLRRQNQSGQQLGSDTYWQFPTGTLQS